MRIDVLTDSAPDMGGAKPIVDRVITEANRINNAHGLDAVEAFLSRLTGSETFLLYDTYGFPLDLTQDALRAQGIEVDMEGFDKCMEKQRADARKAWKGSGDAVTEKLWFELLEECGPTEFLGYKTEVAGGHVLAIR